VNTATEIKESGGKRNYRYISIGDRNKIAEWCTQGVYPAEIAARLGFCVATIYRELKKGATGERDTLGREVYDPQLADSKTRDLLRKRGGVTRVGIGTAKEPGDVYIVTSDPAKARIVAEGLAGRLRNEGEE